jgi:hypothetical protein
MVIGSASVEPGFDGCYGTTIDAIVSIRIGHRRLSRLDGWSRDESPVAWSDASRQSRVVAVCPVTAGFGRFRSAWRACGRPATDQSSPAGYIRN